ncbi:carboxylesterase/lipase family protein [Amycolatopsis sp. H20-H5]|uniref:carboxylesterase/lipase family protein n=1 Tax=Amycolatopsis sp. H20-H5 TaxID=3046309 RepID=UPI002DB7C894|nr:carboxylesterase family protein [Amycolatopsis sp. H20-H5]MEC3976964.1 carboxylesterase family protein [Amycolatopsis sp. H20-H5]
MDVIATTRNGQLRGTVHDEVTTFLGIPYAAPPVGSLRWRPPAPAARWDGVRDATRFGNAAIQTADTGMDLRAQQSEDCLYLNIWAPAETEEASLPVMFWIHGGGFLNGSSSLAIWTGERLCRNGVVVVSVNYRLGAFGFLNHPELGANFGLQDWVAGLDWVRNNIAGFGGDPTNVTIFGQSAGGAATRALLSAPAARGLFHKAVIQSAGYEDYAVVESPSFQRSRAATGRMSERLGVADAEALRRTPAEAVRAASLAEAGINPPPGQVHTPANLVWYPVADGQIMTEDFSGWPQDVPVLLGFTQDEARMFVQPETLYAHPELRPQDVYTPQTLAAMADALAGPNAPQVLEYAAKTGSSPYEAIAEIITAAVWHEPALASLERVAALDRTVFAYDFVRVSPGARTTGLLAKHSAEIAYLFGSMNPPEAYDGTDAKVSDEVQHAWTEFARTGVPSSVDGRTWPIYRPQQRELAYIGDRTEFRAAEPSTLAGLIADARRPPSGQLDRR